MKVPINSATRHGRFAAALLFILSLSATLAFAGNLTVIPATKAESMLKSGAVDFLLDVRTKEEYAEAHIKGATLIPVDELPAKLDTIAQYKNKTVLVYCRSGRRSNNAGNIMVEHGFQTVYDMGGGINDWKKAGYAVENVTAKK